MRGRCCRRGCGAERRQAGGRAGGRGESQDMGKKAGRGWSHVLGAPHKKPPPLPPARRHLAGTTAYARRSERLSGTDECGGNARQRRRENEMQAPRPTNPCTGSFMNISSADTNVPRGHTPWTGARHKIREEEYIRER